MSPLPPNVRNLRLRHFDYEGPLAAHLTFVTHDRTPLFHNAELAKTCIEALQEANTWLSSTLHAYCVMPDHVHVLIELGEGQKLTSFAKRFKQLTGYRLRKYAGETVWQPSYFDRVLRDDETMDYVAGYIWANPVVAGLARDPAGYPYSGPPSSVEALRQG